MFYSDFLRVNSFVYGLGAACLLVSGLGVSACGSYDARGDSYAYSEMRLHPPGVEVDAQRAQNTESYDRLTDNPFVVVGDDPRSTFSVDVDTASYSNLRRFVTSGELPPPDAVRIEELINYFSYDYPEPEGDVPFSISSEVGPCPWNPEHRLVHLGIKGKEIETGALPPRNLTFLLDVSGSMNYGPKLPLLKSALGLLVEELGPKDRVAIVVYAGASGQVLESTPGDQKDKILAALEGLTAGGSTAGGEGIELAYKLAKQNYVPGGINRVILATDGDFNVGISSRGGLERLIEEKRKSGVFLTVLGFGQGNLKDSQMEALADKGNGNYAYIDSIHEARKVLVEEAGATLVTIAKDVKLQLEFNPDQVEAFRLIGYENRMMAHSDFADDSKDAGEIGAGHTVTALYEIVPKGAGEYSPKVAPLKYQRPSASTGQGGDELLTLKMRYKSPDGQVSKSLTRTLTDSGGASVSEDFWFSSAVASYGMLMRGSSHRGDATLEYVKALALRGIGDDQGGYRAGFLDLLKATAALKKGSRVRD